MKVKYFYYSIFVGFSLFCLFACVTPRQRLSREEWLEVSSREYEGVTKDQAIGAVEKLFLLADGDDFTIVHMEDGIYATRYWSVYVVLAAVFGTDYWQVKVIPTTVGVKITTHVNTQAQSLTPIPTTSGAFSVSSMPMAGFSVDGTAIYDVFWRRVDYLLGKRRYWMSCKRAYDKLNSEIIWGSIEALCNGFNMKDEIPLGPMIPITLEANAEPENKSDLLSCIKTEKGEELRSCINKLKELKKKESY